MNHHHPVRGTFGFLWLFSVVLVLAGCAHAPTSAGSTPTVPAPRASPKPSAAAPCQTQHLLLAFDTSGTAMNQPAAQFVFVNQSKGSCTLSGYPALQLLDARHQSIRGQVTQESTAAYLYITRPPQMISLHPGQKAYFAVTWVNLGCATPTAFLRVTPPGNQTPLLLAFRFCAWKEGVEISPVESSQILGVFI